MVSSRWVLYSDGGGQKGSGAAGACIVENQELDILQRGIIYLGDATNNEAEISGGLLGLAVISASLKAGEKAEVRWVCDSEYVLKSATGYINTWKKNGWKTAAKKPVKNQGLWNVYLSVSSSLKIQAEHVRGHTGHEENEACDTACTWAISNARDHFLEGSSDSVYLSGLDIHEQWQVFDGRSFILLARNWADSSDTSDLLGILESFEVSSASSKGPKKPREKVDLSEALAGLEEVRAALGKSIVEKSLARELKSLIKQFSSK